MSIAHSTAIQAYQLNAGGTPARMAILRMIAGESASNAALPPSKRLPAGDWRAARRYTLASYAATYGCLSQGRQGSEPVWYSHMGEYFRRENYASEYRETGIRHDGWYTDDCQDGMARGIVAALPHGRFIAGYEWTDNGERVYFGAVHDDAIDAARMADEHARVFAEQAREDSLRFRAMVDAEAAVSEATTDVQESLALRHKARFGGFARVRDALAMLRGARENLTDATKVYERGY